MNENNNVEKQEVVNQEVEKKKVNNTSVVSIAILFTVINLGLIIGSQFLGPILLDYINNPKEVAKVEAKKEKFEFNKLSYANELDINTETDKTEKPGYSNVVKKINNSIVGITTKVTVRDWFDMEYNQEGGGSGIIFNITDDKIMIVTNNHVIKGADKVTVKFLEEDAVEAYSIGSDPETDLAVVYVNKKDVKAEVFSKLKIAKFGDSSELEVGDIAIAIGNPLGAEFTNTVTQGIVSAINREVEVSNKKFSLIQTDAAINPGNSGGALVNYKGEVVGINTVKLVDTSVEGIGFAIPSNIVKPIVEELVNSGNIARPFFGIIGSNITKKKAELWELPVGVYVYNAIEKSSAYEAGIRKGDIIIELDGKKVTSVDQLTNIIKKHKVGDEVEVKYIKSLERKVTQKVRLKDKNDFNSGRN